MSEPMRFNLKHFGQISTMEVAKDGEFVLHSDYARLKAEVERLRASSFVTAVPIEQYERLRKAGDALQVAFLRLTSGTPNWDGKVYWNWHAAKEGKQP